ncbi:MAG: hypothetical protein KGL39_53505, partial [Patescibacteria group bacterium]|nr:hypothetical protein [Patescibacteria group bacterium]
ERAGIATRQTIDAAGEFWHGTLLWDRIADLQAGIAKNKRDDLMAKGMNDHDATIAAAHFANRFAGAMPREALSDIARKVANIMMFSRSFTLGNLGIMKDIVMGLPSDVRAQISRESGKIAADAAKSVARRLAIGALMTDLALLYGMNAVVQLGVRGIEQYLNDPDDDAMAKLGRVGHEMAHGFVRRWHMLADRRAEHPLDWINPFDDIGSLMPSAENEPGKQDRIFVGTDKQGRGIYVRNPFGKVGEEFKNYLTAPLTQLKAKLSPFVKPIIDTVGNADYFGRKIYSADDGSLSSDIKALGQIIGHWMVAQIPLTAFQGGMDLVTGAPETGMSVAKSVIPAVTGLSVSQGSPKGPQGAVEQQVKQRVDQQFLDAYPHIVEAVKAGDLVKAEQMLRDLGETPSEIRGRIANILQPARPTSPRGYLGREFRQYATPQERERLENVTH